MVGVATGSEVGLAILQNYINIAATVTGFSLFTAIIWKVSRKWNSIESKQDAITVKVDAQHECIKKVEEVAKETKTELKAEIAKLQSETEQQTIKLASIDEKVEYNDKSAVSLAEGLDKTRDFFTTWLQRMEDRFGRTMNGTVTSRKTEVVDTLAPAIPLRNPDNNEIERQLLDIQEQIDRISKRDDRDYKTNRFRKRNVKSRSKGHGYAPR